MNDGGGPAWPIGVVLGALLAGGAWGCGGDDRAVDAGEDGTFPDDAATEDGGFEAVEDGSSPDIPEPDDGGGEAEATGPRTCDGLRLHPTPTSIGIHVDAPPAGAAGAVVRYRPEGAGELRAGHGLVPVEGGRLKGSLFDLEPSTGYQVEVDVVDAAGSVLASHACTAATEPFLAPHATSRTIRVRADAAPGGDGSETAPFASIGAAAATARPGDRVLVAAGIYREAVEVESSGEPGRFVLFEGEPGAILDGSDPAIERDGLPWTADGTGGVWSAPLGGTPGYLARDGLRFYRYNDLAGLRAGLGDDDVPIAEGWVVAGGRLYVRCVSDPAGHAWNVPVHERAFSVWGRRHVRIEGFEIRFYGSGEYGRAVDLRDSSDCVVRRNRIRGVRSGVVIRAPETGRADRNVVEGNWISDPPVFDWPWDAVKGTSHEASAIDVSAGAGNVVRDNRIEDIFNGVYVGDWDDLENEGLAAETDVLRNVMHRIGDDGLEPEGACINVRFLGNAIDRVHSGVSLAPITVGPTWVVRNRFTGYDGTGFKVSNDSRGPVLLYHNTCFTDLADINGMSVSGPHTGLVLRNNVVRGTRYAYESTRAITGVSMDHDNWFSPRTDGPQFKWNDVRYDTIADLCDAVGLECAGAGTEPGLEDPASLRFGLAAGSPNIDAALPIPGINDRFAGAGPDRGYVERGDPEPSW
jgi:hypothetical protein